MVLIEPEIPNNTGNIGRTCVGTNSNLHLVGPLGFEISDRQLKRAGLDYWSHLKWKQYSNYSEWMSQVTDINRVFYFTTKTDRPYYNVKFAPGDWFVFGKETKGLSSEILNANDAQLLTIPMYGPIRSLNLANSVSIVLYEATRQVSMVGVDNP